MFSLPSIDKNLSLRYNNSMKQSELVQPILSTNPEFGHCEEDVLCLSQFLFLLKEEEDYFMGDQENTGLMITRLRKIFYDKWGWNTRLIRNVASVEGRYEVNIVDCPSGNTDTKRNIKRIKRYADNTYTPKCRQVTYRANDRVYGNTRDKEIPEIYKSDHADVRLPDGYHCDLGHVLAGLDALNNPQLVSPLPDSILFLYRYFPYANSNADVATWLGDIATSAMDFLFAYLKNGGKPLDKETEQHFININASASDMLGNIDSYAIHHFYKSQKFPRKRVSDIMQAYYSDGPMGAEFRKQRFILFTRHIGLGNWDGRNFSNEKKWLICYEGQLRSTISFMIYSVTSEPLKKYYLPYKVWKRKYEDIIKVELLLNIFLKALKNLM